MDRTYSSSAMLLCQLCNVVHFPCRPTHQSFKKLDGHLLASQFLKILGKLTCAKKKLLWRPINLDFIAALYLAFKSWEKSEGVCDNNPHLWPKVHRYSTWGLTLQYFYGTFYWKLTFQKKSVEICFRVIYCKWPIIYTIPWHFFCACQHFCLKSGALIGIGLDR